jgi:hypothetical protein
MSIWQTDWPTERDTFWWFYGTRGALRNEPPALCVVTCHGMGNGCCYSADGELLWPSRARGVFMRINTPELPEIKGAAS